jgi:ankyrin repeat protein
VVPLTTAIIHCQIDIAKYLLKAGANINIGCKEEWADKEQHQLKKDLLEICPPLHYAAIRGSAELVHLLVSHGADVNSSSGIDRGAPVAPLHATTGSAVEALINIEQKNDFGWTPLIYVISRKDIDTIRVLVARRAEVDTERTTRYKVRVRGGEGEEKLVVGTSSPLMVACGQMSIVVIQ